MAKYTCTCGARYKFPDSATGKQARCKKCGVVFTLPEEDDDGLIPIAEQDNAFEEAAKAAAAMPKQGELFIPPAGPGAVSAGSLDAGPLGAIPRPTRTFAADVLWTFLFPTSAGNLMTFLGIWIFLVVASLVLHLASYGFMFLVSIFATGFYVFMVGWYCAYQFSIVESAAGGDENLPNMDLSVGWMAEAIGSLIKWIGSWVVVLAPAIAYRIWYWSTRPVATAPGAASGWLPDWIDDLVACGDGLPGILALPPAGIDPFKVLVVLGLFVWPFVILCVAIGGFSALYRVDLIAVTIVRSIGAYAVTVALMVGACALEYQIEALIIAKAAGGAAGGTTGSIFSTAFVLDALLLGLTIYFDIVLMRLIGLYYHHFKRLFAWDWG